MRAVAHVAKVVDAVTVAAAEAVSAVAVSAVQDSKLKTRKVYNKTTKDNKGQLFCCCHDNKWLTIRKVVLCCPLLSLVVF